MKVRVGCFSVRMRLNGVKWCMVAGMCVEDAVLMAESEGEWQKVVDEF